MGWKPFGKSCTICIVGQYYQSCQYYELKRDVQSQNRSCISSKFRELAEREKSKYKIYENCEYGHALCYGLEKMVTTDIIINLGMSTSSEKHVASLIQDDASESRKNRILLTIFVVGVIGFIVLLYFRPPFTNADVFEQVTFPPSAHDLYRISQVLIDYQTEHFVYSLVVFIYLYTLLQAFAIPGPIFLCVLSPALYGAVGGYFLALTCSCLGASLCYFLSYSLARSLVLRKFPALFHKFHGMVEANRQNLFWYMLFLRLTPLIPNWFVNLGSPLVGMPYIYFIIATFFGLMPNNFILIQTGLTLKEIDKIGMSPQNFFTLLGLGCLALIPTLFKKKYEKLPEEEPTDATQPKVQ